MHKIKWLKAISTFNPLLANVPILYPLKTPKNQKFSGVFRGGYKMAKLARNGLMKMLRPAGNYMFKLNNRNARTRCEIHSKLTIKTPERCQWRCQWRRSGVFIVNFEHISHLVLVLLLI